MGVRMGEKEFANAGAQIDSFQGTNAFGNSPEAVRLARQFSTARSPLRLSSRADPLDQSPSANLGDETPLLDRHSMVHYFFSNLFCIFGRFTRVPASYGGCGSSSISQLDCFGLLATNELTCQAKREVNTC
jgi:hypothetical protein